MLIVCDCLRKKCIPLYNWPNHVFFIPLGWHVSRLIFYYCFTTWWWWRHWLIHCIKKQRIVLKFLKRKYLSSSTKTSTLYSCTSSTIQLYYSNLLTQMKLFQPSDQVMNCYQVHCQYVTCIKQNLVLSVCCKYFLNYSKVCME